MQRAGQVGADAYILDLEDAVPEEDKPSARQTVARLIPAMAETGAGLFVRINSLATRYWLDDLTAIVQPGLTGIALPKAESGEDVRVVARVLDAIEQSAGLPTEGVAIQPLLETALGIQDAFRILSSSPRISSFYGGSARDGDTCRDVGYQWTPEGTETLYIRSKLVVDGRAARIPHPVGGIWVDIGDLSGLESFALESRRLGYTGLYLIHPTHVEVANRVFSLGRDEIAYYEEVIGQFEAASEQGRGAVVVDGRMIDYAMARRARELLATLDGTEA